MFESGIYGCNTWSLVQGDAMSVTVLVYSIWNLTDGLTLSSFSFLFLN